MNDGVKILLERMKTNPEEFYSNINGKWAHIINTYKPYLSEEDFNVLEGGISRLMQQRFTEEIMEELVDPKKSSLEDVINQYRVKGMSSVGQTQGLILNSGAVSGTVSVKQAITTLEEIKKEYETKPHKTLFGRLFNYS